MKRVALGGLVVAAVLAAACGGENVATQGRFELGQLNGGGSDFYAIPFPNDLRMRADGTIDLDALPRPSDLIATYLDVISRKSGGFGINSAIFFTFNQALDRASLPASPTAATQPGASVYLVDVDPSSPRRGQRHP